MASIPKFANNFTTTLTQNASVSSDKLYLDVVDGLPDISGGNFFRLTIKRESDGAREIVKVNSVDPISRYVSVERGDENSTPLAFTVGDEVQLRLTAEPLNDIFVEVGRLTTAETNILQAEITATESADAAEVSATNALASEQAAASSEVNALASEQAAALSESNAANSATAANNSRLAAEAVYDQFDDRYLGSKSANPSVDNDGDTLLEGALYWNSTENAMRVWDGVIWKDIVIPDYGTIVSYNDTDFVSQDSNTGAAQIPTGTIAQRPAVPVEGMFRRNSETGAFEGYDGENWIGVGDGSNWIVFDNVAAMQADSTLYVGQKVRTLGYYTPGDGGGNDYEIVADGTGTDDGGSFIDLIGSGTQAKGLFAADINVNQFGAHGDGVEDDSSAVQSCIDFQRNNIFRTEGDVAGTTFNQTETFLLKFLSGNAYVLSTSIDLTSIRTSHSWWYVDMRGATIFGRCTGKSIFDLTDSRKCSWLGGIIIGEESTVCRSGIQIGRAGGSENTRVSDSHHFQDMEIKGYFSLACLYNYASENSLFEHVSLKNADPSSGSHCLIQDGEHVYGIVSDYKTPAALNTPASFLGNTFLRFDARKEGGGATVRFIDGRQHSFINSYLVNIEGAAFNVHYNLTPKVQGLLLDIHVETDYADLDPNTGVDYSVLLTDAQGGRGVELNLFKMRDNNLHASVAAIGVDASISNVDMRDCCIEMGATNRIVGQTLFDGAEKIRYSGKISSLTADAGFDIADLLSFTGEFLNPLSSVYGKTDAGSFIIQDINSRANKNSIDLMVNSVGRGYLRILGSDKQEITKMGWNSPLSRWEMYNSSGSLNYQFTNSQFRPSVDNAISLGSPVLRWSEVFAGTGTINTSDEREKQQVTALDEAEKAAATELKGLIRKFKWNHAVEMKGDAARWHFGVMAQEVSEVFERHGLDAHGYGLLCYDEWDAEYDEDGNEIVTAGNRYGIRYEELLSFVISAL